MTKNAKDALGGFVITACGVIDSETFAFSAAADEKVSPWKEAFEAGTPLPSRIMSHNVTTGLWGWNETTAYHGGSIAGGIGPKGGKQAVFTDHRNRVGVINYADGPNGFEPKISQKISGGVARLRYIGENYYATGNHRTFLRRRGPNDWQSLNYEYKAGRLTDLDGFAEDEIYLCGRNNEFLLWDGERLWILKHNFEGGPWTQHLDATAICCGGDGVVYIAGDCSELIAGRAESGWETLVPQRERNFGTLLSLSWFQGQLYGATNSALVRYDAQEGDWKVALWIDEGSPASFGFLSVKDDRMLVAGAFGASVYDGQTWTKLWGESSGADLVKRLATEQQISAAQQGMDAILELKKQQDE